MQAIFAPVQSVTLNKSNCHADRSGKPSLGIVTKRVGSSAYLNKDQLAHLFLSGRVIQEQIEKIWSANSLPCVVPLFTISTRMLRYTVRFTEVSFIEALFHVFNITMTLAQGKAFKLRKTSISFF